MQEFDQCPGCKEDLLLEDPESNGSGLKCLGCGYACQAGDPQAAGSTGESAGGASETIAYWKRRCQAAESVIESIDIKNEELHLIARQTWLVIKEEGEPA
ncbi:MAG: hypothetical protein OEV91_02240 [Desulfobulbaceae bacterium]|nr:hypothetical protein [Desulfobulbaceae bacterium]